MARFPSWETGKPDSGWSWEMRSEPRRAYRLLSVVPFIPSEYIFSLKAPCLETRGSRVCRRYEIYFFTPVTADDMVANSSDDGLLCCNKILTGKDLLFPGITHSSQHAKGSKLIVSGSPPSPATPIPQSLSTHRQVVPTEPTQTRF